VVLAGLRCPGSPTGANRLAACWGAGTAGVRPSAGAWQEAVGRGCGDVGARRPWRSRHGKRSTSGAISAANADPIAFRSAMKCCAAACSSRSARISHLLPAGHPLERLR
jgi:hypothetical protein